MSLSAFLSAFLPLVALECSFVAIFALVFSYTAPPNRRSRYGAWVTLICLTFALAAQLTPERQLLSPLWQATLVPLFWIQLLSASELLCVSNPHLAAESRRGAAVKAIGLLWNLRRVGTPWQAKNMPPQEPTVGRQGRVRFLLRRPIPTALVAYLCLDVMTAAAAAAPSDLSRFTSDKAGLSLHHLSQRGAGEFILRLLVTASVWTQMYMANTVLYNLVCIASVVLHLSDPQDCPPLYGSLGQASTLRNFWGAFWHQCLRRGLSGHAGALTQLMFGGSTTSTSQVPHYTRLFLSFLISGLIHRASDLAMGVPKAETGALLFFMLQPVGIMLEDGVQKLLAPTQHPPSRLGRRVCGYVWVLLYLTWSTPVWVYPQARLGLDPDGLIPFHLFSPRDS